MINSGIGLVEGSRGGRGERRQVGENVAQVRGRDCQAVVKLSKRFTRLRNYLLLIARLVERTEAKISRKL